MSIATPKREAATHELADYKSLDDSTLQARIGAVRNASDTWWQGWTCGLAAGSSC